MTVTYQSCGHPAPSVVVSLESWKEARARRTGEHYDGSGTIGCGSDTSNRFDISGKVALVTEGRRGLGLALAQGLVFWSGLWCTAELEGTGEVRIEDLFIRVRVQERRAAVTAVLHNDGAIPRKVTVGAVVRPWPEIRLAPSASGDSFQSLSTPLELPAGGSVPVELPLDTTGAALPQ